MFKRNISLLALMSSALAFASAPAHKIKRVMTTDIGDLFNKAGPKNPDSGRSPGGKNGSVAQAKRQATKERNRRKPKEVARTKRRKQRRHERKQKTRAKQRAST